VETLLICLFIAVLFPILAKGPLVIAQIKTGAYDNNNPRQQQAALQGFGARALAAHQNSFEALIMFAPCALAAIATNTINDVVTTSAIVFIVARVLYVTLYVMDLDKLRSLVWATGLIASLTILWQVIQAV
jgi:uncharacterized MAPEG superfamily protein